MDTHIRSGRRSSDWVDLCKDTHSLKWKFLAADYLDLLEGDVGITLEAEVEIPRTPLMDKVGSPQFFQLLFDNSPRNFVIKTSIRIPTRIFPELLCPEGKLYIIEVAGNMDQQSHTLSDDGNDARSKLPPVSLRSVKRIANHGELSPVNTFVSAKYTDLF